MFFIEFIYQIPLWSTLFLLASFGVIIPLYGYKFVKKNSIHVSSDLNTEPRKEAKEIRAALENNKLKKNLWMLYDAQKIPAHTTLRKKIFIQEELVVGCEAYITSLISDKKIFLEKGVDVGAIVDSLEDITISEGCSLGRAITSLKKLSISKDCRFQVLYGAPICTEINPGYINERKAEEQAHYITKAVVLSAHHVLSIPPNAEFKEDLISHVTVVIGEKARFMKSIKCHNDLNLQEGVCIKGNVFADGDIYIGKGSKIEGVVFSQGNVYIDENCIIGSSEKETSCIARKRIEIGPNTEVWGVLKAYGYGKTL